MGEHTGNDLDRHLTWMRQAYLEAEKALELGETPVGAVIVQDDRIIGRGGNRVETLKDPTAHAEILAIGAACQATGYERLLDTVMYVTLEPCVMCAGAIVLARIPLLVWGADDPKRGACGSHYNICRDEALNHRVEVVRGVMQGECSEILRNFFQKARIEKRDVP
ncbi:tRNA adenosine(34) deaminase TadA [Candidatus Latescibacterota bacterium]